MPKKKNKARSQKAGNVTTAPRQSHTFFWKAASPFSQRHPSKYTLDGHQYSTAEQGMMHGKALLFGDKDTAAEILKTVDPRKIKELGELVDGYSDKVWERNREIIVYKNSVAKYTQNDHLREALLNTEGLLVWASPNNTIWGVGMNENDAKNVHEREWKGLNLLGHLLTRVREEIREKNKGGRRNHSPQTRQKKAPSLKTIYLIRHGQSEGQVATRKDRQTNAAFRDCDLTRKGRKEAEAVSRMMSREEFDSIELVVSSPLTRALHTSLLAFPVKHIVVNYGLGEVGGEIPENNPRQMEHVLRDLQGPLSYRDESLLVDTTSLQPAGWPEILSSGSEPIAARGRIEEAVRWLSQECDASTIAVVCHYNVIREAVKGGERLKPANAAPIRCYLHPNGELVLA